MRRMHKRCVIHVKDRRMFIMHGTRRGTGHCSPYLRAGGYTWYLEATMNTSYYTNHSIGQEVSELINYRCLRSLNLPKTCSCCSHITLCSSGNLMNKSPSTLARAHTPAECRIPFVGKVLVFNGLGVSQSLDERVEESHLCRGR
jgi:hypothetical protein